MAIDSIIANASARVAGAIRDAARSTGASFEYLLTAARIESNLNPVAQAKFVHTVAAGYVVGSVFVLAISAWYLLRGRNVEIAERSMAVAASFGLACALSGVVGG